MLNLVLEVKRITKQQMVLKFSEVIKIAQLTSRSFTWNHDRKKKKKTTNVLWRADFNWTYLNQLISGGGDPVALQNKVMASPRSAVALNDFCNVVIAGGTGK